MKNKVPQGVFHLIGVLGIPTLLVSIFLLKNYILSAVIVVLILGVLYFVSRYNR